MKDRIVLVVALLLMVVAGSFGGYGLYATQRYTPTKTASDVEVLARLAGQVTKDKDGKDATASLGDISAARAAHSLTFTLNTKPKEEGQDSAVRYVAVFDDHDQLLATVAAP